MADITDSLTGADRDAAKALVELFKQYGLESLAPKIVEFIQNGYSADTTAILLQDTTEYKQRFAANEARRKKGLPVLSPAEYLSTERSYRQIMQNAGVPVGFYDQPTDFQKFLENDISPEEINNRVKAATDFVNSANQNELAAMKKFYTTGDLIAYALDPDRAQPLVGKAFQAAQIAGQAETQGVHVDKDLAESLAGDGISRAQAQQGFGLIATEQPNANKLASIYGEDQFTTEDLVDETFRANASVAERRKRLASQERASFGGSSGVSGGSLSTNSGGLL